MQKKNIFLIACLLALAVTGLKPVRAGLPANVEGEIASISTGSQTLGINTRLGVLLFVWNSQTLFLLNGHTAGQADMRLGDRVEARYLYPSGELELVHLFRKQRTASAPITAVSNTSVEARIDRANVTLRTDSASQISAAGISISNRAVLVGRRARIVFEPGQQPLLLKLQAKARATAGEITALDAAASLITIRGRSDREYEIVATATIRRDGASSSLAALAAGDTVRAAYVKDGRKLLIIAIEAFSAEPTKTPANLAGRGASSRT